MSHQPLKSSPAVQYRVTGMDCTSCARKIECAVRKLPGVQQVQVSLATQIMTVVVGSCTEQLAQVESAVRHIGYQIERADKSTSDATQDNSPTKPHLGRSYRRALWIVVLLNAG